jgi:hypothetical protein
MKTNGFGGSQESHTSWRSSSTPLYTNLSIPSFFTTASILNSLKHMPPRKAPGKDSITKEMLTNCFPFV